MKLINQFFLGVTVLSFAACSSDGPSVTPTPELPGVDNVAYMAVTITSSDPDGTRTDDDATTTKPENPEIVVNNIKFLFYDNGGKFVSESSAFQDVKFDPETDGSNTETGKGESTDGNDNVNYIGSAVDAIGKKNILIVNGTLRENRPAYLITVINAPELKIEKGEAMATTMARLFDYSDAKFDKNFIMTTSSFFDQKNGSNGGERHNDTYYYATKLNVDDFKLSAEDALTNTNPVEIHVERLAAKVEVTLAGEAETIDNVSYYKLSDEEIEGQTTDLNEGTNLYVKVIGWGLNATANSSYLSKQLDNSWSNTDVFSKWNDPDNWRSYWGKSTAYGQEKITDYLTYLTPKEIVIDKKTFTSVNLGNIQYCYENTNSLNKIFTTNAGVDNSKVTHIVLHTQICKKEVKDGVTNMEPVSLVQFGGLLYETESFLIKLFSNIRDKEEFNFWILKDETTADGQITRKYEHLGKDCLKIGRDNTVGHKFGAVKASANIPAEKEIYKQVTDGGNKTYVKYEDNNNVVNIINGLLDDQTKDITTYGSDDNGDAFYFIPIEHIAASTANGQACEGYYGVVRNHWYKVTINSFKKVGHPVYTPKDDDTVIIPDPENPKEYVGAKVKILKWKVVNQTVNDL